MALAELKAGRIAGQAPAGAIVLGADQILRCEDRWLGKPADLAEARAQLEQLAGRRHELATAVVAFRNGARVWHQLSIARLWLRPCSAAFLDGYLQRGRRGGAHLGRRLSGRGNRARSCSPGSRATSSRSRACRCSRSWSSCALRGCWRDDRGALPHRPRQARRHHGLAGRPFALAPPARPLAPPPRHRRRLRAARGAARAASSRRCARCRRSAFAAAT